MYLNTELSCFEKHNIESLLVCVCVRERESGVPHTFWFVSASLKQDNKNCFAYVKAKGSIWKSKSYKLHFLHSQKDMHKLLC